MNLNDWIGTIGVGFILMGYFANLFNLIKKDGQLFFILNIAGAALACYASWLINYWPFVILEATWCIVSIIAMIKYNVKGN